jgi:hypothetical protein
MGSLPDWRGLRARASAVGYAWPSPTPASPVVSIANLSRTTRFCGMLKSSMFAEMPLDNRTVVQFGVQTAITGFLGRLIRCRRRNDLKFRRDWQFCNIEPKMRQYG